MEDTRIGRPPAFASPEELKEKLDDYFAKFEASGCNDIPEWTDMCNFLDVWLPFPEKPE